MVLALEVNRLDFGYDRSNPILKNISFQITKGEFVAIIGPNGGGKTTLLNLIMGFLKPQSGEISIFNSRIGWVPQHFRFDRDFPITVLEVVLSGRLSQAPWYGGYRKEDKVAALKALDMMGLQKKHTFSFSELSGGQAQRVLLARALVASPELLLLDEPTANVDQEAQKEIYRILTSLKGQITILMVTHDLKTAVKHVDRVFCVQRELSSLSPEEVCQHYALGLYHEPLSFNLKRGEPS